MTEHEAPTRGGSDARGTEPGIAHLLELLATVADRVDTIDTLTGEGVDAQENRAIHQSRARLACAEAQKARSEVGEVRRQARALARSARAARSRSTRMTPPPPAAPPIAEALTAARTVDEASSGWQGLPRLVEGARHVAPDVRWAQIAVARRDDVVAWSAGDLPAAAVRALEDGPRAAVLAGGAAVHLGGDDAPPPADLRGVLALPAGRGVLVVASAEALDDAATVVARRLAERAGAALTGVGTGTHRPDVDARTVLDGACAALGFHLGVGPDTAFEVVLEMARASGRPALVVAERVVAALVPRAEGAGSDPEPAVLRRAESYVVDRAADDITTADIASAAGIGQRGLQQLFRRHHGLTPTQYLRRVRLERAHVELRDADTSTLTVGAVAARWHFGNPGRFSVAYRQHFGTSPSRTLRA